MSFVPSVFSRSRKITQVDLDLSSPCGNTICVPPGHRFFMKVLIVTALSHLIGLKRSRFAHTAFEMSLDIWKAALVSDIFVMGCIGALPTPKPTPPGARHRIGSQHRLSHLRQRS
ncbi:hypothetical protein K443DRAFT_680511 [Laccaria amethystina LaAM-08-1]|uniref:Uncharacterized protein n=1 Tax=Laccaria amethystina LaAM-08-1 TaxID=1095629 RepID=A0A0C9WN32_9AGAR|nr:hypothetical protein K443DRAFT_680511 [Laccaria amethystina LaAM-08-1]